MLYGIMRIESFFICFLKKTQPFKSEIKKHKLQNLTQIITFTKRFPPPKILYIGINILYCGLPFPEIMREEEEK